MKEVLKQKDVQELLTLMESLGREIGYISDVYHKINGDYSDMEEDFDFIEVQKNIQSAIKQVGYILGNKIADAFF